MSDIREASAVYRSAIMVAPIAAGWGCRLLKAVFAVGVLSGLVGVLYGSVAIWLARGQLEVATESTELYLALMTLSAVAYFCIQSIHYFYNSYYFSGLDTLLAGEQSTSGVVYEVAEIIHTAEYDTTASFLHSHYGRTVCMRLGISREAIATFLRSERQPVSARAMAMPSSTQVTLAVLAELVLTYDQTLATWLQTMGIQAESWHGAARWTHREHVAKKRRARWWSKDQLSKKTGIGRDFIYGVAYTLEAYSKSLTIGTMYHDRARAVCVHPQIVQAVELQLQQPGAGNTLLVGEAGVGKLDIVAQVADRFASGEALGSVLSPQIRLLDTERLLATAGDRSLFEQTVLKVLSEAAAAGNTIIVIDDLPAFIASAATYGISVGTLLDEYLAKTALRVIATSTPDAFHRELETNSQLLRYFHIEHVTPADIPATRTILEELAETTRQETGVQCTYQALDRIAVAAERYVVHGAMPDKAIHLFDEVVSASYAARVRTVTVADVDAFVADTTGVPVGPLTDDERALLLDLEAVLHTRIVGQENAVAAISSVMRRARADVQASDKPLGSFLFMGPTGVGKTESAKALAAIFFKREDAMHRFDMSEYSGPDALARLVGSATTVGSLATALTEQPYAVVLLDEFEKAAESVHDIFLQILDEGQFTDGRGQRINARNTIIIATSNAGSDKIMEWLAAGEDVHTKQAELIAYVLDQHIFKPELVNRFDEVVLFTPLVESEQRQIARQLLIELAERIQAKGYVLPVTDELIDTITTLGYTTAFGARPMRRAIQTAVEDAIAKKVLAGTLHLGDTITFTAEELQ